MQMYGEEQAGDGGADTNEIFFSAESKDTKEGVYEIVVSGLPEGVSFIEKTREKERFRWKLGQVSMKKFIPGNWRWQRTTISIQSTMRMARR